MIINIFKKMRQAQVMRYLLVGAVTFLTEYISFALFYYTIFTFMVGSNLIPSQVASFCLAMVINFFGNRMFTFSIKSQDMDQFSIKKQGLLYIGLAVTNLGLTSALIYLFVHLALIHPLVAKLMVMLTILLWNYFIYKNVIFKKR